jgi:hypothetical protein
MNEQLDKLSEKAVRLTEQALSEVTKLTIEQIHHGAENSPHVEAAERDLRNALRQLVMARKAIVARGGGTPAD